MRANQILFWFLAGFFVLADVVYIIWSLTDPIHGNVTSNRGPEIEWVGTVGIGLAAILAGFIGFFISRTYKAQGGELPEDRLDATIEDGDAEQGFYSPWSWWPIMLAASAALVFLGVAVGVWVSFIGACVVVISLVGWQYEYYRGHFAH
jgi:uncharacterized membrane protein